MAERAVHVVIRGRVQGVGFRGWVEDEAEARALSGWVRNRRDGTVEAVFAGDAAAVDAMIAACHSGPRAAVVDDVRVEDYSSPPVEGFTALPTL